MQSLVNLWRFAMVYLASAKVSMSKANTSGADMFEADISEASMFGAAGASWGAFGGRIAKKKKVERGAVGEVIAKKETAAKKAIERETAGRELQ